jgi:uncharacterized protein (TIGR03435 family)
MTRAAAVAILVALVLGPALAQSKATAPEFDVASIKPAAHDGLIENHTPSLNVEPGRNITFTNIALRDLIVLAYHVGIRQISGPDWLTDRFDVVAKVPADATKDRIPLMLQTLLAQRFKLELHREQKTMQIYALEIAKGGPKLQESAPADKTEAGCNRSFAESPGATLAAVCRRMNSVDLAQQVRRVTSRMGRSSI